MSLIYKTGTAFLRRLPAETPRPQVGNAKPRLFRLVEDDAIINRMGFNNRGLDHFSDRLQARSGKGGIVGANLGANKDSDESYKARMRWKTFWAVSPKRARP